MTEQQLFEAIGEHLGPDEHRLPPPLKIPPFTPTTGPYIQVQFIIELVGQTPIQREAALELLKDDARRALGMPDLYRMAPSDLRWRPLWVGDESPQYDSLCFAWDLVRDDKTLTKSAADALWQRCQRVAESMGRKAVPLALPEDAAKRAELLKQFREQMDVGVDVAITKPGGLPTEQVVRAAYAMGYRLGASELLEYRQSGWPEALLTIFPLGEAIEFHPTKNRTLAGVGVGYSVPANPDPEGAFRVLIHTAKGIAERTNGGIVLETGERLDAAKEDELRRTLAIVLDNFEKIGIKPGSAEALRLFDY